MKPMSDREAEQRTAMVNRLRRIEGQIRAISEMVSDGRPCEDVAQQMSAARRALERAYFHMMTCSMIEAVAEHAPDDVAQKDIQRVADVLQKYA